MSLVTSRTPLRVSFFGGGTDYPEYFERFPGAVLGCAINQYVYISAMRLEKFIGYSYRLSYRIIEEVDEPDEIKHPVFKAVFKELDLDRGWNFGVLSSLPSQSGLGSSSSFTVGLVNLIGRIKGSNYTRHDLAREALRIERDVLKENVGVQDQIHAAYGSLNLYEFSGADFTICPVRLHGGVRDMINSSMYLVHTGVQRFASEVVADQIKKTKESRIDRELAHLYALAREGRQALEGHDPETVLKELGRMLDEGWRTKRSLSSAISNPEIDAVYDAALGAGALGGKLCGAGAGGFLLVIVPSAAAASVQKRLGERRLIPIRMDETGSTIISY